MDFAGNALIDKNSLGAGSLERAGDREGVAAGGEADAVVLHGIAGDAEAGGALVGERAAGGMLEPGWSRPRRSSPGRGCCGVRRILGRDRGWRSRLYFHAASEQGKAAVCSDD